jgi:DNA invertase Pin-like site-specific DNA recombinase
VSGVTAHRPGLNALRDAVAHKRLDAIVVADLDRLTRSSTRRHELEAELTRAEVALHILGERQRNEQKGLSEKD